MHTAIRTIDSRALIHFGMITLIFFGIVLGYLFVAVPTTYALQCGCEGGVRYRLNFADDIDDFTCPFGTRLIIYDAVSGPGCHGIYTGQLYDIATCVADASCSAPPPPAPCSSTTFGNCTVPGVSSGSTSGSCQSGYTGSCRYLCTNGVWSEQTYSCALPPPPPPANCPATTIGNCNLPNTSSGGTAGSCASGYTQGGCSYTCNNGNWNSNGNSCAIPPPPPPPPPPPAIGSISVSSNISSASWTLNGPTTLWGGGTNQSYSSQPAGTYTIVWEDVSGYTKPSDTSRTLSSGGSVSFSGNYTAIPPPPPAPSNCGATTLANCDVATVSSGQTSGSCRAGYDGSCSYLCSNGSWSQQFNGCYVTPPPPPPALPPVVSIWSDDATPAYNSGTNVRWSVSGSVSSCTAWGNWSGNKSTGGGSEWTGNLTANATYYLRCDGPGGSHTNSTNVIPGGPSGPSLTFSGNPTSIASGGSTQLSWTVSNADSCFASNNIGDGAWNGWKPTSGSNSEWVSPSNSGTYSLECWNGGVPSGQQSVNITVSAVPPPSPACSDTDDNDGDGKVDASDPGCSSWSDNDETDTALPPPPPPPTGCSSGTVGLCTVPNGNIGDIRNTSCSTGYSGSGCNVTCNSGSPNTWEINSSNCNAPTVTQFEICDITLTTCVSSGGTITVPAGGQPGGQIIIRWDSDNASNCSPELGTGFVTGGNPSNTGGITVTPSNTPGNSEPYTIRCSNGVLVPSDSRTITVNTSLLNPELRVTQNGNEVKTVSLESDVKVEWNTNGEIETACSLTGGGLAGYSPSLPSAGDPYTGETPHIQIKGRTTFKIDCNGRTDEVMVDIVPIGWES